MKRLLGLVLCLFIIGCGSYKMDDYYTGMKEHLGGIEFKIMPLNYNNGRFLTVDKNGMLNYFYFGNTYIGIKQKYCLFDFRRVGSLDELNNFKNQLNKND